MAEGCFAASSAAAKASLIPIRHDHNTQEQGRLCHFAQGAIFFEHLLNTRHLFPKAVEEFGNLFLRQRLDFDCAFKG